MTMRKQRKKLKKAVIVFWCVFTALLVAMKFKWPIAEFFGRRHHQYIDAPDGPPSGMSNDRGDIQNIIDNYK